MLTRGLVAGVRILGEQLAARRTLEVRVGGDTSALCAALQRLAAPGERVSSELLDDLCVIHARNTHTHTHRGARPPKKI